MPLLALVFSSLGIWGGHLVGVDWLGVDAGAYWGNMQATVDFRVDVLNGLIKAFVFGVFVTWIAVYQGMDLVPTAEGSAEPQREPWCTDLWPCWRWISF